MRSNDIPFQEIAACCRPVMLALCQRWLSHGHRSGNWWVCSCPWRQDKNASLMVSLTTGHWEDRGGAIVGKDRGDPIKLYGCIYGKDMVDSANDVAILVGHEWRKARRA